MPYKRGDLSSGAQFSSILLSQCSVHLKAGLIRGVAFGGSGHYKHFLKKDNVLCLPMDNVRYFIY